MSGGVPVETIRLESSGCPRAAFNPHRRGKVEKPAIEQCARKICAATLYSVGSKVCSSPLTKIFTFFTLGNCFAVSTSWASARGVSH
jgi:hypothetical protein